MKLSEKITELRKANGMTQEELASICNVSRQAISKWEADIALPETEKLLILGDISFPAISTKHSLISSVSKPADVNNTLMFPPIPASSSAHWKYPIFCTHCTQILFHPDFQSDILKSCL